MPNVDSTESLFLCAGKDCFKKQKFAYGKLRTAATKAGLRVETLKCQGICIGPTAVAFGPDGPQWYEDLRSKAAQRDLVKLASGRAKRPSKRLKRRQLTGKRKRQATRRFSDTAS